MSENTRHLHHCGAMRDEMKNMKCSMQKKRIEEMIVVSVDRKRSAEVTVMLY